jgi:RelE-like toxin of type II toxin-antitoxin system HigB
MDWTAGIHPCAFGMDGYPPHDVEFDIGKNEESELLVPPGNRLEKLKGDREGQYSIRINDQYRICFVWKDNDAYQVEIVDYH